MSEPAKILVADDSDASLRSFWPKKSVVSSDIFKC